MELTSACSKANEMGMFYANGRCHKSTTPAWSPSPVESVSLGKDCQSASCETANSACVTQPDSSKICECQAKYIQISDTICQKGPEVITQRSEFEFSISRGSNFSDFEIPFDGLMGLRDLINISVDVIPTQEDIALTVGTDALTLAYTSAIMTSSRFAAVLSGESLDGTFSVQQVVSVNIEVRRDDPVEHIQVLLLSWTRHNTLVVEMRSPLHISQKDKLQFGLKSDSDDSTSLFTVDVDTGRVATANDVALGKDMLAKDYSFNITEAANNGVQQTVAMVDVLVVRDDSAVYVDEGYAGELMSVDLISGAFVINLNSSYPGIDLENGSVLLTTPRDYQDDERFTNIRLDVWSLDINTNLGITLRIRDTNDKRPNFASDRTDVFIAAGASSGTIVAVVSADDPDTVGEVTYSLHGRYVSDFRVDKSGTITALGSLKRSKFGESFTLEVKANDGINESENNSLIHVTLYTPKESIEKDLNMTFMVNVTEHEPVGTFVLNVSAHVANYRDFTFLYPSTNLPFSLNSSTSIVTIGGDMDREAEFQYWLDNLDIVGFEDSDKCNPVRIGELDVKIIDKNDQPPTFSRTEYEGEVVEESDMPVAVYIQLSDGDIGPNADLRLSTNDSNFDASYNGNQVTLTPKTPLDREAVPSYTLELLAVDSPINGDPPLTGSAVVVVRVMDINDHDPVFVTPPSEVDVTENTNPGVLATLKATDEDEGANADITFSILSGGLGYFIIDDIGELSITKEVDRETFDQFDLLIRASDKGPFATRRVQDISVTVYVKDMNDNPPKFDKGLRFFELFEKGECSSLNVSVCANDPDEGENGTLRYILNHPKFSINESTGDISCTTELDHENETDFTLTVSAIDNGTEPMSSETTVKIKVADVNDNAPAFSNIVGNKVLDLSELEAGQFVMFVQVTDADSGTNAEVKLSVSGPNSEWFQFDPETPGVLKLTKLDITVGSYTLTLTATDGGDPPLISYESVELVVQGNVDEESTIEVRTISVPEGSYAGETIGKVLDGSDEKQGSYRLSDTPSGVFVVDETTGGITVTGELDRENKGQHLLLVNASYTEGGVQVIRRVLVILDIEDKNDNSPQFVGGEVQENDVPEDAVSNTFVQALPVTDLDAGQNGVAGLQYSIINTDIPFAVDPATGDLTTQGALDRETEASYLIIVQVKDGGTPSKSATANISIFLNDINDNSPNFTKDSYVISVPETTTVGTRIGEEISASDPDYDLNGTVTFIMNSDPALCPFFLTTERNSASSSGILRLEAPLDFETTQTYQCTIRAVDASACGEGCSYQRRTNTTLRVVVVDNNDERPTFQGTPYVANVTRDAVSGHVITDIISATDADTDNGNNVVSYKLLNYKEFFIINATTGVLTVKSDLAQLQEDTVQLQVEATDNPVSDQPLSATTTIEIDVFDINTRPWFPNAPFRLEITEEEVASGPWSMRAWDKIEGENVTCNCTYTILPSKFSAFFTIDEAGFVSQVETLDREETGNSIELEVEATDSEIPRKSVTSALNIRVQDIDDNIPYFTQRRFQFSVNETIAVGASIGRLNAVDEDEGDNAVIIYSAIAIDTRLSLKEDGTITVLDNLLTQQQSMENIKFAVSVFDGKATSLRPADVAEVNITVHPYDSNSAPRFERDIYETVVRFLSPRGTSIKQDQFRATDVDGDTVTYSIAAGNTRNIIDMDSESGSMTLNHALESSIGNWINLTVEATDDNVRPKSGSCLVTIRVLDSEPTACVAERQLQIDSEQREVYLGLFIGMAVLLALAFMATIFTCYNWRAAKSKSDFYRTQSKDVGDTRNQIKSEKTEQNQGHEYSGLDVSKRAEPNEYDRSAMMRDFSRGSVHNPGYVSAEKRNKDKRGCVPPPEPIPDYDDYSQGYPARFNDRLSRSVPVVSNYTSWGYRPTLKYHKESF